MPDYRQKGKVAYPLDEVLLLMLAAALAGAETVADIARFGRAKLSFLRRFRPFANGTPSHDQLGIILARLDPAAFQRCFVAWTAALTNASAEVIAIDGKTVRRSYQKKGAEEPIHVVSAFAARQRMVLGQTRVGDKSNEIVAIPALLDLLAIEGAVVTIDAMGCQREIAQKIIDKKADTILALKGNQGTLRDDVEMFAREQKAVAFKNTSVSQDTTVDGDHGRIETRTVTVFHDIAWLQDNRQWPGLKSVVMVESERETDGKVETETRFYITSLALLANALGPMIRSHWMVENGLHWVLDMIFRDDECRVRTDNAPSTSLSSSTSPSTCSEPAKARICCACAAKSPRGMKTPSPPTSPHDAFSRFPWARQGIPSPIHRCKRRADLVEAAQNWRLSILLVLTAPSHRDMLPLVRKTGGTAKSMGLPFLGRVGARDLTLGGETLRQ